jgi:hypothetical protein
MSEAFFENERKNAPRQILPLNDFRRHSAAQTAGEERYADITLHKMCASACLIWSYLAILDIRPRDVMNSAYCPHDSSLELFPCSQGETRRCNRMKVNARLAVDKAKRTRRQNCARTHQRVPPCGSVA